MPRHDSPLHGLLIVDKPGLQQLGAPSSPSTTAPTADARTVDPASEPRLFTSHDIVQLVRRWSGQRRIGHTGTLDPLASGVLVLCLGQATRLVEYYQGHDKQYDTEITLGQATDTYDSLGQVTATATVPHLTTAQIETALQAFRGAIQQTPPIYSALKQGGESVHYKARRGEAVTLAPRPVTIHQLDLVDFQPPRRLVLRVRCSAGAYIRSLAHDLGQALNCYGHLSRLRREAAGAFTLQDAHPLTQIEPMAQGGRLGELLLPLGQGLSLPRVTLDADAITRFGYGQSVRLTASHENGLAGAWDEKGHCVGIIRCLEADVDKPDCNWWKAEKWFAGN
ncbi:MAG: tRNA pseudouridine(55) synthase TruB [Caldilineaceae bacterium]